MMTRIWPASQSMSVSVTWKALAPLAAGSVQVGLSVMEAPSRTCSLATPDAVPTRPTQVRVAGGFRVANPWSVPLLPMGLVVQLTDSTSQRVNELNDQWFPQTLMVGALQLTVPDWACASAAV